MRDTIRASIFYDIPQIGCDTLWRAWDELGSVCIEGKIGAQTITWKNEITHDVSFSSEESRIFNGRKLSVHLL